jgi:hypothetical protein
MESTMSTDTADEGETGRGRDAEWPSAIPLNGWKDILWRVWREINDDRIMLIAAGATFYLLLALFPALAAFVSLYGFVADPTTIAEHIAYLGGLLPSGGLEIIQEQLTALASQDSSALSIGFIVSLALAFWSANSGIKTLFDAMNIAYDETEKRGFIALNLLAMTFTLGAIIIGIAMIMSVGVIPAVLAIINLGGAEPHPRQVAMDHLGRRARNGDLAAHLDRLLVLPAELRRLQRYLRFARRGHRLHGLDLDIGHNPAGRSGTELRNGASDGPGFDDRAGKATRPARRERRR